MNTTCDPASSPYYETSCRIDGTRVRDPVTRLDLACERHVEEVKPIGPTRSVEFSEGVRPLFGTPELKLANCCWSACRNLGFLVWVQPQSRTSA